MSLLKGIPPQFIPGSPYSPDIQLSETDEQPTDTISKISWGSTSSRDPIFATSNWDSHIRIYQVNVPDRTMTQKTSFSTGSPSLCVNWHPEMTRVFAGCAPNLVKEFDVETGKEIVIGRHKAPIKDVYWLSSTQTLCSISSDKTVKFWDVRQSDHVGEIKLKSQPYCSDMYENKLILGLRESQILLLDVVDAQKTKDSEIGLNYLESPMQSPEPYTSIKFMADGKALGFGGLEGRGNVSDFQDPENLDKTTIYNRMVWRVDRSPSNELVPIKCMFTCKRSPDFIGTCMSNGKIIFWDCNTKMKIKTLEIGVPLACSEMSSDGNLLAFATGENWCRGEVDSETKKSKIFVHIMKEDELTFQGNEAQ